MKIYENSSSTTELRMWSLKNLAQNKAAGRPENCPKLWLEISTNGERAQETSFKDRIAALRVWGLAPAHKSMIFRVILSHIVRGRRGVREENLFAHVSTWPTWTHNSCLPKSGMEKIKKEGRKEKDAEAEQPEPLEDLFSSASLLKEWRKMGKKRNFLEVSLA